MFDKKYILGLGLLLMVQLSFASDVEISALSVIYVDASAPASGDGTSWATAFDNLQDALAVAVSGKTIWVAKGVYYPDVGGVQSNDDQNATFALIDGVSIYGGFAGTETALSQRDVATNVTILSGDITQNDTNNDMNFIAEITDNLAGPNSQTVINGENVDNNTRIDGMTITAGSSNTIGGGIYCGNSAQGPSINQLTFIGNKATDKGGAMYGCAQNINQSLFSNNRASIAGAIYSFDANIANSEFVSNTASGLVGGAIRNSGNNLTIINSKFIGNSANFSTNFSKGGAIWTSTDVFLENSLFSGNSSMSKGGALFLQGTGNAHLVNVTLTGNKGAQGGAIGSTSTGTLTIENTIIWNNQDNSGIGTATASINHPNGTSIINNSLVQGFDPAGTSNLNTDPEFVLATDPSSAPTSIGDAHLTEMSIAIDTGDNTVVNETNDLDGNNRIFNTTVDMGAYEYIKDAMFKDGFE